MHLERKKSAPGAGDAWSTSPESSPHYLQKAPLLRKKVLFIPNYNKMSIST